MSSRVDMSLDDIISKNRSAFSGSRRSRGGRVGRGLGREMQNRGRGGAVRSTSGFRSQRGGGNINARWSHDMYYGGASTVRPVSSGSTKLNITNLDYGVSDSDVKELFSEFGMMKVASVHYDRSGRSLGTAHVIFERRAEALKAYKQYDGVHLDGRPMRIEIDGGSGRGAVGARTLNEGGPRVGIRDARGGFRASRGGFRDSRGGFRGVNRLQGGPRPIGGGGPRGRGRDGRGRGRGRGGNTPKKIPTAEELDKELEDYTFQSSK